MPDQTEEADLDALPPMIVSLGDSYISGEAGRWAGNAYALADFPFTDALGSDAYDDAPGGELDRRLSPLRFGGDPHRHRRGRHAGGLAQPGVLRREDLHPTR